MEEKLIQELEFDGGALDEAIKHESSGLLLERISEMGVKKIKVL